MTLGGRIASRVHVGGANALPSTYCAVFWKKKDESSQLLYLGVISFGSQMGEPEARKS